MKKGLSRALRNQAGLTLLEAVLGLGISAVTIFATLFLFDAITGDRSRIAQRFIFITVRNELLSLSIDDLAWAKTAGAPENASMGCLVQQNSTDLTSRSCSGKSGGVVILNRKAEIVYDRRNASTGTSIRGGTCETFSMSAGDPACPLRSEMTWEPICDGVNCVNPSIRLTARHRLINTRLLAPLNLSLWDFQIIKSGVACPEATTPIGVAAVAGVAVGGGGSSVTSALALPVPSPGYARSGQVMAPCRRITLAFNDDMKAPGAITAPAAPTDAGNIARVMVLDELNSAPIFEFRRRYDGATNANTYEVLEGGVVVGTKPSWLTINNTSQFQFEIINGLLRFCVNGRCLHYFTRKLDFPFRFGFQPSSQTYAPLGIYSITEPIIAEL